MVLTLREANLVVKEALAAARQSHSKIGVAMVLCREQKIVTKDMPAKTKGNVIIKARPALTQPKISANRSSEIALSKAMPTK
jgi:hypothetical protein